MALLTEVPEHTGDFFLRGFVDQLQRTRPVRAHAHVQRTVFAVAEPSRRVVELHGRNAEVVQDTVGMATDRLL
jgi:hypothetical protein